MKVKKGAHKTRTSRTNGFPLTTSEEWKRLFKKPRKKRKQAMFVSDAKHVRCGFGTPAKSVSNSEPSLEEQVKFLLPEKGEMAEKWEEFKAMEDEEERCALKPYAKIFGLKNY